MTSTENNTLKSVLTVGPSRKTLGGMASVLNIYQDTVPGFKHLASNSHKGTVAGAFALLGTMLRMPIERMRGRRILHVHSASGKSFVRKSMLIRYGRMLGYKVILHWHGAEGKEYFRRIGHPKARNVLRRCSALIVLSRSWQEYFESTFNLDNVHVLNNPVMLPDNPPMPPVEEPVKLLFLGRLGDRKGVFDLIDVMARNKERWRGRVHLSAGGDGEIDRFHQEVAELGIGDMVDYIGWVSGERKEQFFASHHILILPSYNEGLPVSVLEGLAHHKPIISTPVGGIAEAVIPHRNGFLVTPGDKKEIAQAIDCYLLNPELISRHGQASAEIARNFSPEYITSQLLHIYEGLD